MEDKPADRDPMSKAVNRMFVDDVLDFYTEPEEIVYADELPPGEQRDEAEAAIAELRRRRAETTTEGNETPPADPPDAVRPALTEVEIRAKGLRIHVPFDAPPPNTGPVLSYSNGETFEDKFRRDHPEFYAGPQPSGD